MTENIKRLEHCTKRQKASVENNLKVRQIDEAEDEPLHSGGETEGSDFVPSDDELLQKRAKKRRKTLRYIARKRDGKKIWAGKNQKRRN
jgi:hypothetical protein